jgi:quercetin dioxygenase-like cupin family protein
MTTPVLTLKSFISYQTGSVVSKEISRKPTGSVTVFAFDAEQGLSEHTAPFDAIVQIIEGSATIQIDREPYVLTEGQSIVMPANHPHSLQANGPFKMLLTMIRS